MKKFRCMPAFMGVPVIFFVFSLFYVYILLDPNANFVNAAGEPDPLGGKLVTGGFLLIGLTAASEPPVMMASAYPCFMAR